MRELRLSFVEMYGSKVSGLLSSIWGLSAGSGRPGAWYARMRAREWRRGRKRRN
jgi:hypothetical protein